MSNRAALEQRVARLTDIGGILGAMKNLSLLETRKLARFIEHQRRMRANIEAAAADFLHFFPAPPPLAGHDLLIVIGSERGFCGSFNERVVDALQQLPAAQRPGALLAIGRRLSARLSADPRLVAAIDGATVAEDVPGALDRLLDALQTARATLDGGAISIAALAWGVDEPPRRRQVLPLTPRTEGERSDAPRLNLAPADFFHQLLDHYLPAALQDVLYESLTAENRLRLQHMDHALDRLGETLARLNVRRNALRQEKIVEEIEVILASSGALGEQPGVVTTIG